MPESFPSAIQINNDNRESITKVLFQIDPNLLDSIARTFYDSHIEVSGENPTIKPNAKFYVCPYVEKDENGDVKFACNQIYDKEVYLGYSTCNGTLEHPHPRTITIPKDWHPILTDAGFNFILGALEMDLNGNLATGNYGEREVSNVAGAKNKMNLEKELMRNSHKMACFMINTLLGNIRLYINPEYYTPPKKISNLFTYSFVYKFVLSMTRNIFSVLSRGKSMDAVNAIATNRLVYEERAERQQGYSSTRQEEQSGKDMFGKVFEKIHGL